MGFSRLHCLLVVGAAALGLTSAPAKAEPLDQPSSATNVSQSSPPPSTNTTSGTTQLEPKRYWYGTVAAGALQPQNQSGYVETHYGYAISGSVQRNVGFSGEVGVGYNFGAIRTELTYGYVNNSLASSQASAQGVFEKTKGLSGYTVANAFLASAYWDIKNKSRFTPYLGGGFGYGLIYQSPATFQMGYGGGLGQADYISVPAYQGKIGVSYKASRTFDVFIEGVYRGTSGYTGESGFTPNPSLNGPLNYWGGNVGFRFRIGG